ncbi:aminotransferase class IV [Brevundimonas basaltis]|uniref:aminotransferase class IV n=1 Tax=Brevundimonas basaltis TaxID=472166 RepID=UPI0031D0B8B2
MDGEPASIEALTHQALVNYGAYTSFRVEDGAARGLDLHLERLRDASIELFGEAVPEARLLELMRAAMEARETCWLRVSLFSDQISNRDPTSVGRPRVMIAVFDPPPPLAGSLRLQVQRHERIAPHLKHAANMDLLTARRRARAEGFDDALFADREGAFSEGTLWNIGFVRGDVVTWPRAPILAGVTQRLIQAGLADVGLSDETRILDWNDVAAGNFRSAFICNSATPACPVTGIDSWALDTDPTLIDRLRAAWASQPCQPI